MGLIADNARLDDEALLDLICSPGFSTRDEADRASGRGVGMSVVKNTVLGLGGVLTLDYRGRARHSIHHTTAGHACDSRRLDCFGRRA